MCCKFAEKLNVVLQHTPASTMATPMRRQKKQCQKVPWPSSSLSKFASFGFCSIIFNGFSILLSSLVFSLSPSDSLPGSLSAVFSSFRCEFSFFYVKIIS